MKIVRGGGRILPKVRQQKNQVFNFAYLIHNKSMSVSVKTEIENAVKLVKCKLHNIKEEILRDNKENCTEEVSVTSTEVNESKQLGWNLLISCLQTIKLLF